MNKAIITAPQIDRYLEKAGSNPTALNAKCIEILVKISNSMSILEQQGEDELRSVWIEVARGDITDFGNFKEYKLEGIVKNKVQFNELWLSYYQDNTKWYKFTIVTYKNEIFCYFNSRLCFHIMPDSIPVQNIDNEQEKFLEWLHQRIIVEIQKLMHNQQDYNDYINKKLPFHKRFGRILPKDFWSIWPEENLRLDMKFNDGEIQNLEKIVKQSYIENPQLILKDICANDFFRFCEIGYDTNGYFNKRKDKITPLEKYLRMADGRDCGLRNIEVESFIAFRQWYEYERNCGGHPWEIFRGGNSTHISLYVVQRENCWLLRLAGNSRARVVETVKMALALYMNQIPFYLENAEEILSMVLGHDYIGIVPDYVFPRYCHSLFPKEDNKILEFMNLSIEKRDQIIQKTHWYPIDRIKLRS